MLWLGFLFSLWMSDVVDGGQVKRGEMGWREVGRV